MRKPMIAGNWKMNKTASETAEFISQLKQSLADVEDVEILVCPAYTALSAASKVAEGSNILIGAQDMYIREAGAFTGAISPLMVKEFCQYVILGHSERRLFFAETNDLVNEKSKLALEHELIPIVCVGETLEEKKAGESKAVVERQVTECLSGLTADQVKSLIIAYEPVWAISGGDPNVPAATPETAQEMHAFIRSLLAQLFDKSVSADVRILYGGSMKPENVKGLMAQIDIDGGLVGGASLVLDKFIQVVRYSD